MQVEVLIRKPVEGLQNTLHLHPYHTHVVQELKEPDMAKCLLLMVVSALIKENGVDIVDNVFFNDKPWLHLSGCVNSQNSRTWSSEYPHLPKNALAY
jgi:hypothetical protein